MIAHPCPCEEEEIVFVPKSFSEVQMPSSRLSFDQMPASNSDGLLANRAFMRRGCLLQLSLRDLSHLECVPLSQEAATRLPGGVKRQAQLCLSQLSTEKLYEGKIVIAFKLGLLVDINADVLGLLRWKHVKGAYSEMVPMTRASSFEGPGPIRANSDGIVPFLRMVPDSAPMQEEEIVFVPKSFSEVQMPSNGLSFEQMPASNSDGLLANRAFMRAVDAARAQAAQQKAEEAATRLPGGVKRQAQLCLSQLSTEKLYEGKIVIAFKLGDLPALKLLKEGGNLANLRVEKVRGQRFTLRLECIGLPGQTFEETEYPDIVARVYDWAIAPKLHDVSAEEVTPTAAQKQRLGKMGPRNVGDGEGLAIRGPAPFNARRGSQSAGPRPLMPAGSFGPASAQFILRYSVIHVVSFARQAALHYWAEKAGCAELDFGGNAQFARVWTYSAIYGLTLTLGITIPFRWCAGRKRAFKVADSAGDAEEGDSPAKKTATMKSVEMELIDPTPNIEAAKAHLVRTSATVENKWLSPLCTPTYRLSEIGGTGTELYFRTLRNLGFIFAYMAAATGPLVAFCLLGNFGPDTGQFLLKTTIGNLGEFVEADIIDPWSTSLTHDQTPLALDADPRIGRVTQWTI
eukprot:s7601_g1.t1